MILVCLSSGLYSHFIWFQIGKNVPMHPVSLYRMGQRARGLKG